MLNEEKIKKLKEKLKKNNISRYFNDIIELSNLLNDYFKSVNKNYKLHRIDYIKKDNSFIFKFKNKGIEKFITIDLSHNGSEIDLETNIDINHKLIDKINNIVDKITDILISNQESSEVFKIRLDLNKFDRDQLIINQDDIYYIFNNLLNNKLKEDKGETSLESPIYYFSYNNQTKNLIIRLKKEPPINNIETEKLNLIKKFNELYDKLKPNKFELKLVHDSLEFIHREKYNQLFYKIQLNKEYYNLLKDKVDLIKNEIKSYLPEKYHSIIDLFDETYYVQCVYGYKEKYHNLTFQKQIDDNTIFNINRQIYIGNDEKNNKAIIKIYDLKNLDIDEIKHVLNYNVNIEERDAGGSSLFLKDKSEIEEAIFTIRDIFENNQNVGFKIYIPSKTGWINVLKYFKGPIYQNQEGISIFFDSLGLIDWIKFSNLIKKNKIDNFIIDAGVNLKFKFKEDGSIDEINLDLRHMTENTKSNTIKFLLQTNLIYLPGFINRIIRDGIEIC